jgi:prepilin-type N-terminal cleavage/methylation domain-containing protein
MVWSRDPSANPNGIPARSPGLSQGDYPGSAIRELHQPQRGCGDSLLYTVFAATPLGLLPVGRRLPKVGAARQPWAEGRCPVGALAEGRRKHVRPDSAFTLIETIAVMAVLAILAAVLVPTLIRRIDRAAWTKETADLNSMADALSLSILRGKTVPGTNEWATNIASQMSLPVSSITTNSRRNARAFLVDPNFSINSAGLPYTQNINGATNKPVSARVMILSSIAQPLPVSTGVPTSADFNNIWNAAENTVPAGSPFTGWGGTGEDLRIKKLNLEPLFYQLVLYNHDPTNITAPFSIDRQATNAVSSGPPGWNKYYLASSDVWLLDSNYNLRTRYLLNRSISFIFESGSWRGQIQGGETFSDTNGVAASAFLSLASTFYNTTNNPSAAGGASPSAVLISMYTFMFDYVFWATQCPHFDWHGYSTNSTPSGLPEYKMLNDMGQTSAGTTAGIDGYSGKSGLLK